MSEETANKLLGEDVEVYHSEFKPLEFLFAENESNSFIKIIVEKSTDIIKGIHILSPNSGEIMQGFSLAVRLGLKFQDLHQTIGIHPTIAEQLVTMEFTKRENPDAL